MALTKEKTQEIVEKFKAHPNDSGTASVQIALLTERIGQVSKHRKTHSKDYSSQLGLAKMVSRRKRLLTYLTRTDKAQYVKILKQLDLRK